MIRSETFFVIYIYNSNGFFRFFNQYRVSELLTFFIGNGTNTDVKEEGPRQWKDVSLKEQREGREGDKGEKEGKERKDHTETDWRWKSEKDGESKNPLPPLLYSTKFEGNRLSSYKRLVGKGWKTDSSNNPRTKL